MGPHPEPTLSRAHAEQGAVTAAAPALASHPDGPNTPVEAETGGLSGGCPVLRLTLPARGRGRAFHATRWNWTSAVVWVAGACHLCQLPSHCHQPWPDATHPHERHRQGLGSHVPQDPGDPGLSTCSALRLQEVTLILSTQRNADGDDQGPRCFLEIDGGCAAPAQSLETRLPLVCVFKCSEDVVFFLSL